MWSVVPETSTFSIVCLRSFSSRFTLFSTTLALISHPYMMCLIRALIACWDRARARSTTNVTTMTKTTIKGMIMMAKHTHTLAPPAHTHADIIRYGKANGCCQWLVNGVSLPLPLQFVELFTNTLSSSSHTLPSWLSSQLLVPFYFWLVNDLTFRKFIVLQCVQSNIVLWHAFGRWALNKLNFY